MSDETPTMNHCGCRYCVSTDDPNGWPWQMLADHFTEMQARLNAATEEGDRRQRRRGRWLTVALWLTLFAVWVLVSVVYLLAT